MKRYFASFICLIAVATASQETKSFMVALETMNQPQAQIIKDYFATVTCKTNGYLDKSIVDIKAFTRSPEYGKLAALKLMDDGSYQNNLLIKSEHCSK